MTIWKGEIMSKQILIEDYNPQWESIFYEIKDILNNEISNTILSIEHVGSTSIKGLGAKPILDIDIVIEDYSTLPNVIQGLEMLGYFHQPEWSFEGREAFGRKDAFVPWDGKDTIWMEQNLYVCVKESKELARHLAFRNYLRKHPEEVQAYHNLKKGLADVVKSRNEYSEAKTEFVYGILEKAMNQ